VKIFSVRPRDFWPETNYFTRSKINRTVGMPWPETSFECENIFGST